MALSLLFFFRLLSTGELIRVNFTKLFPVRTERKLIRDDICFWKKKKHLLATLAYQGALYMKKADFVKGVKDKIKTFKKGAQILEDEIAKKPSNAEFRFLRLAVQEHAPRILKYNKNINEDKKAVIDGL